MRRLFLIFASVLIAGSAALSAVQPEALHYKVMFKWGLINKKAGTATLTLREADSKYETRLTAASEPWADRIYRVRDTLNGRMDHSMSPLFYEKIAHEGNDVKHDIVQYDFTASPEIKAQCHRKVYKKGILKKEETRELSAEGEVVDMLTSFYFMRSLPYQDWEPGHVKSLTIFSGKQKETLSIKYDGIEEMEYNGEKRNVYHIRFMFTSKGGKKSSDDMDAWISTDSGRIPVKLEGRLPVGKVQCIFTGSD